MKIYRDLTAIQKKEQRGRRITLAGLLILFVGLLSSFTPNWFPPGDPSPNSLIRLLQFYWAYLSFGALALGFIASNIGSYYINRFAPRRWPETNRIARPDELIENGLKGFDDKYSLFLWSLDPTPYLLVGPLGVLVLIVRGDKGTVRVSGDRWREAFNLGRIFTAFTREGMGNPGRELEESQQKVRELIQAGEASGELELSADSVPVEGAVVFINPATRLELENPSVPVLRVDQLKKFVRGQKTRQLSPPQLRKLTQYLRGTSAMAKT